MEIRSKRLKIKIINSTRYSWDSTTSSYASSGLEQQVNQWLEEHDVVVVSIDSTVIEQGKVASCTITYLRE